MQASAEGIDGLHLDVGQAQPHVVGQRSPLLDQGEGAEAIPQPGAPVVGHPPEHGQTRRLRSEQRQPAPGSEQLVGGAAGRIGDRVRQHLQPQHHVGLVVPPPQPPVRVQPPGLQVHLVGPEAAAGVAPDPVGGIAEGEVDLEGRGDRSPAPEDPGGPGDERAEALLRRRGSQLWIHHGAVGPPQATDDLAVEERVGGRDVVDAGAGLEQGEGGQHRGHVGGGQEGPSPGLGGVGGPPPGPGSVPPTVRA